MKQWAVGWKIIFPVSKTLPLITWRKEGGRVTSCKYFGGLEPKSQISAEIKTLILC